jgi:hypothetical protein
MSFSFPPQDGLEDDPHVPKPGEGKRLVVILVLIMIALVFIKRLTRDWPLPPQPTASQRCMVSEIPELCLRKLKESERRSGNTQAAPSPVGNR